MKYLLLFGFTCIFSSCQLYKQAMGISEEDVIKTASIEQDCPISNIKVIDKIESYGNSTYVLEICEQRKVYKIVGSVILEKEQADKLIKL